MSDDKQTPIDPVNTGAKSSPQEESEHMAQSEDRHGEGSTQPNESDHDKDQYVTSQPAQTSPQTFFGAHKKHIRVAGLGLIFFTLLGILASYGRYVHIQQQKAQTDIKAVRQNLHIKQKNGFEALAFQKRINELENNIAHWSYYMKPWEVISMNDTIDTLDASLNATYKEDIMAKKETLKEALTDLEASLSAQINAGLPSYDNMLQSVTNIRNETTSGDISLIQIGAYINETERMKKKMSEEIELTKRQALIAEMRGVRTEVDGLVWFYQQRNGYEKEKHALQRYIEREQEYLSKEYQDTPTDKLRTLIQNNLYPFIELPRNTRPVVEEQERLARLEEQRRIQQQTGVPPPPIETPKLIVVNIAHQRLYAYENGISIFDYPVPVTTGKNGYATVRGQFNIHTKASPFRMRSPFPDEWYDNWVTYWMPFYQGYGLHDAPWRGVYGTQDYPWVGSHGCVNIPYAEVERLYHWAEIGTPVIVQ